MRITPLLLLFLLLPPSLYAAKAEKRCFTAFQGVNESSPGHYEVSDGRFFASAEVMPNETSFIGDPIAGQRTISITIYLKDTQGRSPLSGADQYQKILQHFDGKFDQIQGMWNKPIGAAELSDNLQQFNQLTSGPNALLPEQAALQTWSGQQAAAAGYTKVVVHKLSGTAGHYTHVTVRFKKP